MNKNNKNKLIMIPLITLALSACQFIAGPNIVSSSETSSEESSSNIENSTSIENSSSEEHTTSEESSSTSENSTSEESSTSENTSSGESSSSEESSSSSSSEIPPLPADAIDLNISSDNFYINNKYSTGNYGATTASGNSFEYYRAVSSSSGFIKLLPYVKSFNDGSAPGSLYNTTAIKSIHSIDVTYKTELTSGASPSLIYGENNFNSASSLPLSENTTTQNIYVGGANYFKIESSQSEIDIIELTIHYTNKSSNSTSFTTSGSGLSDYRINPVTFSGTPNNGSSVSVPTDITISGNYYTAKSFKTYTYYSFSYISANPDLVDEAAMIDPIDVAAYYTIFKSIPVNYFLKDSSSKDSVKSLFGSNARQFSQYDRTDGYATAVPYTSKNGTPSYYEFDIDIDGTYSTSSRGVGRVIGWEYGFNASGYDSSPVCVFTDDHYATFQEYLNYGSFGIRFNAECKLTNYIWGSPTTLVAK
ncbi:MAG: hypothetical protein LBM03_00780 [Erysipelotrichaceae bacterium]|jgi:hypothetical protein|nr:hypothetical protein [Erysipelotrichaceae bacterium]